MGDFDPVCAAFRALGLSSIFGRAESRTCDYWVKSAIATSELCRLQKELKKPDKIFLQKCCNIFDSCLSDFGILLVWNDSIAMVKRGKKIKRK